jgi:hypothetical protein
MIARLSCDHSSSPRHFAGLLSPQWVNRDVLRVVGPLPVYPEKRTSSDRPGWPGSCHERKSLALFDHFIRERRQGRWNFQSYRFRGL